MVERKNFVPDKIRTNDLLITRDVLHHYSTLPWPSLFQAVSCLSTNIHPGLHLKYSIKPNLADSPLMNFDKVGIKMKLPTQVSWVQISEHLSRWEIQPNQHFESWGEWSCSCTCSGQLASGLLNGFRDFFRVCQSSVATKWWELQGSETCTPKAYYCVQKILIEKVLGLNPSAVNILSPKTSVKMSPFYNTLCL